MTFSGISVCVVISLVFFWSVCVCWSLAVGGWLFGVSVGGSLVGWSMWSLALFGGGSTERMDIDWSVSSKTVVLSSSSMSSSNMSLKLVAVRSLLLYASMTSMVLGSVMLSLGGMLKNSRISWMVLKVAWKNRKFGIPFLL